MKDPQFLQYELPSTHPLTNETTRPIKELFYFHNMLVVIKLDNHNYMA